MTRKRREKDKGLGNTGKPAAESEQYRSPPPGIPEGCPEPRG